MTHTQASPQVIVITFIAMGFLAMTSGLAGAQETQIYKSIAEDGSTVFTDQPAPDATVIKPAPLNVMDSPDPTPTVASAPTTPPLASKEPPTPTIDSVVISHPLAEQTFFDPEEQILVEFSTSPASSLPTGISANVRLDDVLIVTGSSYQMPIDVPERGTHDLQIQLVDQTGSIIAESELIQIHVKQHVAGSSN